MTDSSTDDVLKRAEEWRTQWHAADRGPDETWALVWELCDQLAGTRAWRDQFERERDEAKADRDRWQGAATSIAGAHYEPGDLHPEETARRVYEQILHGQQDGYHL